LFSLTATLVGLAQVNASVSLIAFTGELNHKTADYLKIVNKWLRTTRLPQIYVHPCLSQSDLERLLVCPLKTWGWAEPECKAALQLAGLPLPN
jgi:hypothetical protein